MNRLLESIWMANACCHKRCCYKTHILMHILQKLWLTLLGNRVIGNYYNFLLIFMKIKGTKEESRKNYDNTAFCRRL